MPDCTLRSINGTIANKPSLNSSYLSEKFEYAPAE